MDRPGMLLHWVIEPVDHLCLKETLTPEIDTRPDLRKINIFTIIIDFLVFS